jgi:hypothetical protein
VQSRWLKYYPGKIQTAKLEWHVPSLFDDGENLDVNLNKQAASEEPAGIAAQYNLFRLQSSKSITSRGALHGTIFSVALLKHSTLTALIHVVLMMRLLLKVKLSQL